MLIIGCDVSKYSIDFYILNNQTHCKFTNNENGYLKLIKLINKLENNSKQIKFCMEATGNYYEDFADFMSEHGFLVSVVNPLKIAYFAKSEFKRTKTDKADAKLIADYCAKINPKADYFKPTPEQYQSKRLISYLKSLNQQKIALKNRLKSAKDDFIKEQINESILFLKRQIKETEKKLNDLNKNELRDNLKTIPSIGEITATIISHFLNMHKFNDSNQFASFCGLSPQIGKSGTSVNRKERLSTFGNRILKSVFYMPAVVAYRIGLFKDLTDRLERKGKKGKVIIGAIMRKLAVLAWTLHDKKEQYKQVV